MIRSFFNRQCIKPTFSDKRREDLHIEVLDKQDWLEKCAKQVIVKNGVINLYPEGPDKEVAKEESEKAKKSLLTAIGSYDGIRCDMIQYIKKHSNDFVTTVRWPLNYITSHEIIERAYARFFQENS